MSLLEHLEQRHLDLSLYRGAYVSDECATFLLWNLSGQLIGYQEYRPGKPKIRGRDADRTNMRYYTYVSRFGGLNPAVAVWGLETLRPGAPVFLCEGIFDACRLHKAGLPALALLGSDQKPLASWLGTIPYTKIAVIQGDVAGRKVAKFGDRSVGLPDGEDVGSLDEAGFSRIFKPFMEGSNANHHSG